MSVRIATVGQRGMSNESPVDHSRGDGCHSHRGDFLSEMAGTGVMTVMVQTTTNYNAAGKIVSVIVFRVPVEDKMKPTDAQIEVEARARAWDALTDQGKLAWRLDAKAVLTPAAEVEQKEIEEMAAISEEYKLDPIGDFIAEKAAAEVRPNNYNTENYSYKAYEKAIETATIERCAQVADSYAKSSNNDKADCAENIATSIRALKDKQP